MSKTLAELLSSVSAMGMILALILITTILIVLYKNLDKVKKKLNEYHEKENKKDAFKQLVHDNHDRLLELEKQREIDVEQSIKHDEKLEECIKGISKQLYHLSAKLDNMESKNDKTYRAQLKSDIGRLYRKCHARDACTSTEFDSLESLMDQYEACGGDNSFVHDLVKVEMYTWKVIEEEKL